MVVYFVLVNDSNVLSLMSAFLKRKSTHRSAFSNLKKYLNGVNNFFNFNTKNNSKLFILKSQKLSSFQVLLAFSINAMLICFHIIEQITNSFISNLVN